MYSGTSDKGPSQKGIASQERTWLQEAKGQLKQSFPHKSWFLIKDPPRKGKPVSIRDKVASPKVLSILRFQRNGEAVSSGGDPLPDTADYVPESTLKSTSALASSLNPTPAILPPTDTVPPPAGSAVVEEVTTWLVDWAKARASISLWIKTSILFLIYSFILWGILL